MILDDDSRQFVERMGVILSNDGLPRIAGRIFGLLLLHPDEASLDDIAELLGVSKASVSLDARRLEQRGVLVRISRPGDRRDYYRVADDLLQQMMRQRLQRWRTVHETVAAARERIPALEPAVARRLDEFAAGSDFICTSISRNLARWVEERSPSAEPPTS